jgi:hypothetical protein
MRKETINETRERVLSLIETEFKSDAEFEREMKLPGKTVNNWRRGLSSSFMKMLPELAAGFGIGVGELLDMPITRDSGDLSDDEIELLSLYRKSGMLSPKQKLALKKTLESVIELYINSCPSGRAQVKKSGGK